MDVKKIMNQDLVLASASPRRKELMEKAGFQFEILVANTDESYPADMDLYEVPQHIAEMKALAVAENLQLNKIIIAADTIVICNNEVLGKPRDLQDATTMLEKLSGQQHQVVTGVCIKQAAKQFKFQSTTEVYFSELHPHEIEHYVQNYEVLDKAGAYAIQEWIGLNKIIKIEGCYFNVVGLPTSELYKHLSTF